jgi:hypothetical protein
MLFLSHLSRPAVIGERGDLLELEIGLCGKMAATHEKGPGAAPGALRPDEEHV